MINLKVKDRTGGVRDIEIPEDVNLSLMEVLRACEYEIAATCGGIALCATCHVEVAEGAEQLGEASDVELDMIDSLPNAGDTSRLACQIRIGRHLDGLLVVLK